jgi:hypothetical protein
MNKRESETWQKVAEGLQADLDAMTARCAELLNLLKLTAAELPVRDELYGLKWDISDALTRQPHASLLMLKAEVLDSLRDKRLSVSLTNRGLMEGPNNRGRYVQWREVQSLINKLRAQAEEDE